MRNLLNQYPHPMPGSVKFFYFILTNVLETNGDENLIIYFVGPMMLHIVTDDLFAMVSFLHNFMVK